jgi:hypothetical protein
MTNIANTMIALYYSIEDQLCSTCHKYTVLLLPILHLYVYCTRMDEYLLKVGGGVRTCVYFLSRVENPIFRSAEYAVRAHVAV